MNYWLMKSEPDAYSWQMLCRDRRTHWHGVRSHQAAQSLRAMAVGELAFFYHSNIGLEIVGIMRIVKTYYPDPSDEKGKFGMVDVEPVAQLRQAVTLKQIKAEPSLETIGLVRQSRLSVMPIAEADWQRLLEMAGGKIAV